MYHMSIVLSRWTVFSCMVILKYSDNGSVAKFLQTWPLVSWTWIIITSGFMCRPFHWKILSASAVHATVVVESNIYPGLIAPWSVNNLNYTTTITIQCLANAPCLSDLTERSWILGHDSRSFGVSLTLRSKQQFLGLPYLMNFFFSVWNCVFNCFECFYNWILIPKMALSVLKGLAKLKVTFFWADINLLNV